MTEQKPGRVHRAVRAVWERRILLFALALVAAIELTITVTQIPFYRGLPMLRPELGGVTLPVYVMLPIWTTSLSVYFAAAAGFVIEKDAGRYRRYLRLMWAFASIGAVINVSHALHQLATAGSAEWLSAVLLGGGSLFAPVVWHTYAGITLDTKVKGRSIAEVLAISRQWARHPFLSWRTAQYLDLFPSLDRTQVWDKVSTKARKRVEVKLGMREAPPETSRAWKRSDRKRGNTPETPASADGVPAVDEAVVAELEARLAETPSLPDVRTETPLETVPETRKPADENASETTAERNYKRLWVAAAFVVVNRGLLETVPSQNEIARRFRVSPSHVSKVFTACRDGEINTDEIGEDMLRHATETLSGNTHKAGEESRNVSA